MSSLAKLFLTAALCGGAVFAQEPSVIIKSLDNLEKRIIKVEGEVGRLKKNSSAAASTEKNFALPDTTLPKLAARLDSMMVRLNAIENRSSLKTEPKAGVLAATVPGTIAAKPDSISKEPNRSDEIASLVREVKAMIEILKQSKTSPDSAPSAVIAKADVAPPTEKSSAGTAAPLAAPTPPGGLDLKGDIQIQGERKLTSASSRNNLDDFWGRLNFGAEYNQGDFQSKINIRIFPEGFGFEPLTGATFDTTGQGSLKVQTQPSSRVVINHAWAKYAVGSYRLKFGRFETMETQSSNYGNYVDLGPGGKFMSRPAVHNAIELSRTFGPFTSSALLGTNDGKLNRGFLRLYEKYAFTKKIQAAIGYRANIFDRFKYEDQEILQRYDLNLVYGLPAGWKAYSETALLQVAGKKDDTPILLGVQPPTGKVVDALLLETEYLRDRVIAKKKKEWLMNFHVRKVIGRLKLESSLTSDLADPAWNAFSIGLRVTSNIK